MKRAGEMGYNLRHAYFPRLGRSLENRDARDHTDLAYATSQGPQGQGPMRALAVSLTLRKVPAEDEGGPFVLRCGDKAKREFAVGNLWMNTGVTSHGKINWCEAWTTSPYMPHSVATLWKVAIALFGLCILGWGIENSNASPFWLIYLTDWMLLTHATYLFFQGCIAIYVQFFLQGGRSSAIWAAAERMPIFVRICWFTQTICLPGGFLVTILFWTLLVSPGQQVAVINYFVHATVWAVCTLDYLIGMQPFLLVQCLWFMVWALCYLIWSIIHDESHVGSSFGGNITYIYPVLDWDNKPGSAAILSAVVILLVIPILYSVLWATNMLRFQAIYTVEESTGVLNFKSPNSLANQASNMPADA